MAGTSLYMVWFRFIAEMFSALSAVFLFCRAARLAVHYLAVYSILGSLSKQSFTATATSTIGVSYGPCEHSRAVRLFLRASAVIDFLMRAASTLEITHGEQRALCKFYVSWNLSLFCAKLSNWHVQNRTTGAKLGNMIRSYCASTIPSSLHPIIPCFICRLMQITSRRFTRVSGWTLNGIWSFLSPVYK